MYVPNKTELSLYNFHTTDMYNYQGGYKIDGEDT